jgi:hypothetical protein
MRALKWLVVLAASLGAAYAASNVAYPTYSYRYRLTIALEIDGKVHTGSSVIEPRWVGQAYIPGAGSFIPYVRGQAAFIDLGQRGAVVALLTAPSHDERGIIVWPEGVGALWLVPRAFGTGLSDAELPDLGRLSGRKELAPDNMPRLIWFSDVSNPRTARKIRSADIPAIFGPSARVATAFVEITRDPIVVDIGKKLPWFDVLTGPLGQNRIEIGYDFALSKDLFVGDD